MNALSLSVREKEPVCRMKCVFTLDSVDVKLDFTGTSAKLLVLLSFGDQTVASSVPATLTDSVIQPLAYAHACPTAGAACARTAANVAAMANVTLSMGTAPVRRAGGHPLAPKHVSATSLPPPVTKPQAAAFAMRAIGAKSAACHATAMCPLVSSALGHASACMAGGARPVTAAAFAISTMLTVMCKLVAVCATQVTKSLSAMSLVTVENMAEAVRTAVDVVKEAGLALSWTACVMPVNQDGMALAVINAVLRVIMAIAAKKFVRIVETWTHVTRKLVHVCSVILAGLDQDVTNPAQMVDTEMAVASSVKLAIMATATM